jgi:hypothetical protein
MTTNSSDLFISNDLVINPFNDKFVIINPINVKSKNFWKSIINEYGGNWKNNKGGWIFPKYNLYKLKNSNTLSNKSSFCFDNNEDDLDNKDTNKDKSTQESDDDIKDKNEDNNKDKEESSEESDDSSSTDDELIQKVLARRLMSESTQDIIDNDLIEDSENEDVISLSRRLRHLYKEFNTIKNQLKH